jgi:hypothetical protein
MVLDGHGEGERGRGREIGDQEKTWEDPGRVGESHAPAGEEQLRKRGRETRGGGGRRASCSGSVAHRRDECRVDTEAQSRSVGDANTGELQIRSQPDLPICHQEISVFCSFVDHLEIRLLESTLLKALRTSDRTEAHAGDAVARPTGVQAGLQARADVDAAHLRRLRSDHLHRSEIRSVLAETRVRSDLAVLQLLLQNNTGLGGSSNHRRVQRMRRMLRVRAITLLRQDWLGIRSDILRIASHLLCHLLRRRFDLAGSSTPLQKAIQRGVQL